MQIAIFKPESIIDEVFALCEKQENQELKNSFVLKLQYMAQAAALAEDEGFEDEVVLAAFFHNIGYFCPVEQRETSVDRIGSDYLRERGFSERVASLVESHVLAKRYLTYKYPEYYDQLSEAGKAVLEFQGGPMTEAEAIGFEINPDAELFLRLHYWDDKAKEVNQPENDLAHLKLLAISHLYKNN
jgi:predicted HD phosphohydrolase